MIRRRTAFCALPLTALWLSVGALADSSPYYIGVTQGLSYDSNVFRLPDAFAQSSWWGTTGVVAGFDQPYARQRFYGSANVSDNYYSSLSQLNNVSYALNLGWDWATIDKLSGKLDLSLSENLGNYGGSYQNIGTEKNIQNATQALATVNYGLLSLWVLEGRLAYSSTRYSAKQYDFYELDQAAATLGVRKQFSGQLTLGSGLAYTRGDYYAVDRQFDRYDLFVSGRWLASGLSTLSGRLNYSWWDYTGRNPYTTGSATGWMRWDYAATGKLNFNALISYDTLANSGLTNYGGAGPVNLGDTSQLTAGVQLGANWQVTGKIQLTAALNYFDRKYDTLLPPGNLLPPSVRFHDQVTVASIGANWTPTRNWLIACSVNTNNRNQKADQPVTLSPYGSWGGSCTAQFALQ